MCVFRVAYDITWYSGAHVSYCLFAIVFVVVVFVVLVVSKPKLAVVFKNLV